MGSNVERVIRTIGVVAVWDDDRIGIGYIQHGGREGGAVHQKAHSDESNRGISIDGEVGEVVEGIENRS